MRYLIALLAAMASSTMSYAKCPLAACYEVEFQVRACTLRAVESVDSPDGAVLETGPVRAKVVPCSKGADLQESKTPLSQVEREREFFYRTSADGATCDSLAGKHITLFAPNRCCDMGTRCRPPARELVDLSLAYDPPGYEVASVDPSNYKTHPIKYPKGAAEQQLSGRLMMRVLVGEKGEPLSVKIVRATPPEAATVFGSAATEALSQWTYSPGTKDGKPYASFILIPLDFSPKQ
jgi:protein TonB